MDNPFERTEILIGKDGICKLQQSHAAVFGVGGVGGYAVESLVRSGIGELSIIDKDVVSWSNLNRQIIATRETIGMKKVEVLKNRCLLINPDLVIHTHFLFFLPENAGQFDFTQYDYIIDAVDTVTAKLELVTRAKEAGTPIISCMGAGNKLNSGNFKLADIYDTRVCPLAKIMRRECRKRGIESLPVLYSDEQPRAKGVIPGSTAFAPAVAGLMIAEYVFRELLRIIEERS
jgi:tRNA A37 threonylcarbamoyladenosine dehydratase